MAGVTVSNGVQPTFAAVRVADSVEKTPAQNVPQAATGTGRATPVWTYRDLARQVLRSRSALSPGRIYPATASISTVPP